MIIKTEVLGSEYDPGTSFYALYKNIYYFCEQLLIKIQQFAQKQT